LYASLRNESIAENLTKAISPIDGDQDKFGDGYGYDQCHKLAHDIGDNSAALLNPDNFAVFARMSYLGDTRWAAPPSAPPPATNVKMLDLRNKIQLKEMHPRAPYPTERFVKVVRRAEVEILT
jgi:hypothetical protein